MSRISQWNQIPLQVGEQLLLNQWQAAISQNNPNNRFFLLNTYSGFYCVSSIGVEGDKLTLKHNTFIQLFDGSFFAHSALVTVVKQVDRSYSAFYSARPYAEPRNCFSNVDDLVSYFSQSYSQLVLTPPAEQKKSCSFVIC